MRKGFLPLFTTPSIVSTRKTVFQKYDEKVVVEAPEKLIRQLIQLCDGTRSFDEVIKSLKNEWDDHSVRGLITELHQRGVLVDSRFISDAIWKAVENPSHFPSSVTDNAVARLVEQARERHKKQPGRDAHQVSSHTIGKLLAHRRSVRSFSANPVALQSVVNMLWCAYGEIKDGRRTVPSAGALYPLMLHVALLRQTEVLIPAVYRVHLGSPKSVEFDLVSEDTNRFMRSFVDPLMLENAHGVIVISGAFRITGKKYGNRSMLYVPLEAGHTAQNVHLAAAEHDVATVEIGGFVEELLGETIRLPRQYRPLTTVVFGYESNTEKVESANSKIEVHWAVPIAGQYRLPFTMAFARSSSKINKDWSCGRAVSPRLAHTKAVFEAREWAACGCIPNTLVHARLADLKTAIDPRSVIKFHPAQYRLKGFPFKSFSEEVEYVWTKGRDELRGKEVYVLADLVYFPYYPKTPKYAHANSSGVAAHSDKSQAIKNGALELVERDSFMIAYLTKLAFPTVSEKTLPREIRRRISELRESGFKVWVKDYSLDLAPVVFVFAQNEKLTFTTCAGCADFDTEVALDHALMEVGHRFYADWLMDP
jgi:SagB-type dehydrogenase family enzyme